MILDASALFLTCYDGARARIEIDFVGKRESDLPFLMSSVSSPAY
jgi:hypothetical protein